MNEWIQMIDLDGIEPHPGNRRIGGFNREKLEQLAESIRAVGVQQPAVVRRKADSGMYELVAGERHWRAARLAGIEKLPCIVRDLDDTKMMQIQLIENLQREGTHPLDEGEIFHEMLALSGQSVRQIAESIGKSDAYVYMRTQLSHLVPVARDAFSKGVFGLSHAVELTRLDPDKQIEAVEYLRKLRGRHAASLKGFSKWLAGSREIKPRPKRRVGWQEKEDYSVRGAFSIMITGGNSDIIKILPTSKKQFDQLLHLLKKEGGEVI